MRLLDLTLATPDQNLACDEALLDWCEDGYDEDILRFWEPPTYFVVLGYTNKIDEEVNRAACRADAVPILRRTSGGGTVLQGPGCLNYTLILRITEAPPLNGITETNAFIMGRHRDVLQSILGVDVAIQGYTDLTLGGLKFSGNAQRRKRRFLLFHGTFLLDFDIPLVEKLLRLPTKQPEYRRNRAHGDFLTNLKLPSHTLKNALKEAWNATGEPVAVPTERIASLIQHKYASDKWNSKF